MSYHDLRATHHQDLHSNLSSGMPVLMSTMIQPTPSPIPTGCLPCLVVSKRTFKSTRVTDPSLYDYGIIPGRPSSKELSQRRIFLTSSACALVTAQIAHPAVCKPSFYILGRILCLFSCPVYCLPARIRLLERRMSTQCSASPRDTFKPCTTLA